MVAPKGAGAGWHPSFCTPVPSTDKWEAVPDLDDANLQPPRSSRLWQPRDKKAIGAEVKREAWSAVSRMPEPNGYANAQWSYSCTLPSGCINPVSAMGECGDRHCPFYRPKQPEVREAMEDTVVDFCVKHFKEGHHKLRTYVSFGCGLLAQDWLLLQRLAAEGVRPSRGVFVDVRTARPVLRCKGGGFPRQSRGGGMNLRQLGFNDPLGPEFSFFAELLIEEQDRPGVIFDFNNGPGHDAIFGEVQHPRTLVFGVSSGTDSQTLQVDLPADRPNRLPFKVLFTITAKGTAKVMIDSNTCAVGRLSAPKICTRKQLFLGQSDLPHSSFKGDIKDIVVWDVEVDWPATCNFLQRETETAFQQMAQWYFDEMFIWSFGSLASYCAAVKKEPRFAADVLMKLDVQDDVEAYDEFGLEALSGHGLALTMGGGNSPGSWMRSGGGYVRVRLHCPILEAAEKKANAPFAKFVARSWKEWQILADPVFGRAHCRSRRRSSHRRPEHHSLDATKRTFLLCPERPLQEEEDEESEQELPPARRPDWRGQVTTCEEQLAEKTRPQNFSPGRRCASGPPPLPCRRAVGKAKLSQGVKQGFRPTWEFVKERAQEMRLQAEGAAQTGIKASNAPPSCSKPDLGGEALSDLEHSSEEEEVPAKPAAAKQQASEQVTAKSAAPKWHEPWHEPVAGSAPRSFAPSSGPATPSACPRHPMPSGMGASPSRSRLSALGSRPLRPRSSRFGAPASCPRAAVHPARRRLGPPEGGLGELWRSRRHQSELDKCSSLPHKAEEKEHCEEEEERQVHEEERQAREEERLAREEERLAREALRLEEERQALEQERSARQEERWAREELSQGRAGKGELAS